MKYIVTGLHSSGKAEVAETLEKDGVRVGKIFTNLDCVSYHQPLYECLTTEEINQLFENGAYIYFSEVNNSISNNYECLSTSEFDNNDVFVLSPNQINNIPLKAMPDKVCFVWMDSNSIAREARYKYERRQYNFHNREEIERISLSDYIDKLYNMPDSTLIYFQNEDPQRVAAIVEIMVKYPETRDIILKTFKN